MHSAILYVVYIIFVGYGMPAFVRMYVHTLCCCQFVVVCKGSGIAERLHPSLKNETLDMVTRLVIFRERTPQY